MQEEKNVADYFVVAGMSLEDPVPLEEFSNETALKPTHKQDPIVDVAVIIKSMGEACPPKYKCVEFTPTGFPADLNHGSIRAPEIYLCYRRGRDKPPLTDLGVLYEGKDRVKSGCEVVHTTPHGRPANVNNSNSSRTYITYRRADETAASDTLAVTDVCIILANKSEVPPHAFCQIGKNLNKGMVGSDVFLCYKKSMAKADTLAYKPVLLSRYPVEDNPNFPLPQTVPMFCLPLGASLECWPARAQHPLPVFSTFVLTGAAGEKVYGAAVMFYEEFDKSKLSENQVKLLGLASTSPPELTPVEKSVHHNKCICLLSRWPFFDTFRKFLSYIYRLSISGPHLVPLERHISHFMTEVPFPSPQRPRILVQLNEEAISLSQPEETPLPQSGASFITLLKYLGPENCLTLLLFALMEHKVLIHSLRPAVLTSVAEALCNMIFPFHWQCPYIPLCPLGLSDVLNAPFPFIVGVDSRYFDLYDPPPDVTCVDLDTNTISPSEDRKGITSKLLPKRPAKILRATLDKLFDKLCQEPSCPGTPVEVGFETAPLDHDFMKRRKELVMETAIREAFLRFMACLLKGYDSFLLPITRAPTLGTTHLCSLFDVHGFLKSRDKAYHKFFTPLMETQLFSRFIEERSFVSDKDASLAFFDECLEKVDENRDEPRLIELDDTSKSERTVFVMPPEPTGLPSDQKYSYNGFPDLSHSLFLLPKKPTLVTPLKTPQCPHSPMTRRTKQEIRSAQKNALKHAGTPMLWAKCLLGHCFSLWFIHLPAYVKSVHSKTKALRTAYDVLVKMQNAKLQIPDEVSYRVLMQLCGLYHQPVLAVKLLFEMKRNGVQPNAITYGFYNKAVLESKWPSSDSNACIMWTKLRNVVLGVAQFRQALKRRRRLSMYSTSESDFDRISRASTDSYMDEVTVDKTDSHTKTEFVTDLVAVESPNNEEKTSTGGMSDRGYSSMNLEDAKRISMAIGSQDSLDSLSRLSAILERREGNSPGRPITKSNQPTRKIIKFSKNSATVGSSAGLLMTSQITLDDNLYGAIGVSQSLNAKARHNDTEIKRRRHKSAEFSRRRQHTFPAWRPRHYSSEQEVKVDLEINKSKGELAGADRSMADIKEGGSGGELSKTEAENENKENVSIPEESSKETGGATRTVSDPTGITLLGAVVDESSDSVFDEKAEDKIHREDSDSKLLSPTHSIRTPVTENDPLGLFNEALKNSEPSKKSDNVEVTPSCTSSADQLFGYGSSTKISESKDSSVSNISQKSSTPNRGNFLIDLEPFSNTSTPTKSKQGGALKSAPVRSSADLFGVAAAMSPETDGKPLCSKSASFSSSEASSPSSPEAWAPLSQSHSEIPPPKPPQEFLTPNPKSSTLPPNMDRYYNSDTAIKRGKFAGRSESFGKALRSAAGLFANKFNEIKQSMTPTKAEMAAANGSNTSLPKPHEMEKRLYEEDEEALLQKAGSLDQLGQKEMTADRASLDGQLDGSGRGRANKYNVPYVSDILDGLFNLQSWSHLQGLAAQSLESLKGPLSDYAQYLGTGTGGTGSSASQSNSQDAYPMQELDNMSQGSGRLTAGLGSITSIPQSFFNMAMEVEMCTLSKCTSCSSLLYDEEIMAGWSADDSNLNTTCQFCSAKLVPTLQIQIKDFRQSSRPLVLTPSQSSESMQSIQSMPNFQLNPSSTVPEHPATIPPNVSAPVLTNLANKVVEEAKQATTLLNGTNTINEKEVLVNGNVESESTEQTSETDNNENCAEETESDVKTGNLIELSPAHTKHETSDSKENTVNLISDFNNEQIEKSIEEQMNGEVPVEDCPIVIRTPPGSPQRRRCASECNTSATPVAPPALEVTGPPAGDNTNKDRKNSDGISQTSIAEEDCTSINSENKGEGVDCKKPVLLEPITIPYLSPLVLRKEVENVLEQEGDLCLSRAQFLDEHPIIFWNLVWYFKRLDVPTHLNGFVLSANSTNKEMPPPKSWSTADSRHVSIRPVWDNQRMHEELGQPMYFLWNQLPHESATINALLTESQTVSRSVMQHIVSDIMCSDVVSPINLILNERRKQKSAGRARFRSIYRDILFLSFAALGRDNIDHDAFDREYREAYSQMTHKELARMRPYDKPPRASVVWCRRMFSELELRLPGSQNNATQ